MEETPKALPKFRKPASIKWYRCKVDPQLMSELMQCSDGQGLRQALGHLGLWCVTATLAFLAFRNIHPANWFWTIPVLYFALMAHGIVASFLGGTACHEMSHKTPFKTKAINDFFLKIFAFLGWWDQVWFRPSHIRHHQVTTHHDYDGEVVLPQKLTLREWQFWLGLFAWNPVGIWTLLKTTYRRATGRMDNDWYEFLMPGENEKLRREHRNWARITLIGHGVLALIFIATGNWILIPIVNLGSQSFAWLGFLCYIPQHYGLSPNVPDHRLCCRTYTCAWLPGFLYWGMQYHIEHHMFPAVPFYNLPRLRKAIGHDLSPAHHGLLATWKEIMAIHRRTQTDPGYLFVPPLPTASSSSPGATAEDTTLEREAALTN